MLDGICELPNLWILSVVFDIPPTYGDGVQFFRTNPMNPSNYRSSVDLVFPRRCGLCRSVGPSPCWCCLESLPDSLPQVVRPSGCASIAAAFEFTGPIRQLVRSVKYGHNPGALRFFAGRMAGADLLSANGADVVTWVPTSPSRRRGRGFDQSEVLAGYVGLLLGIPVRALLRHVPDRGSQTGQSRRQRLQRRDLFVPMTAESAYRRVLLIDDVVTTGASLSGAARALHTVGVQEVHGLVAAATP
jgi:predicted amidophosphoribosyltransferase